MGANLVLYVIQESFSPSNQSHLATQSLPLSCISGIPDHLRPYLVPGAEELHVPILALQGQPVRCYATSIKQLNCRHSLLCSCTSSSSGVHKNQRQQLSPCLVTYPPPVGLLVGVFHGKNLLLRQFTKYYPWKLAQNLNIMNFLHENLFSSVSQKYSS